MSIYWLAPLASLATLLGGWGVVRFLQGRAQFMRLLSGVAAGYLLSVTLVRIIPECFEAPGGESNAFWVLAGYLLVHVMEHGITLHFHYGEETHKDGSPLSGVLALVGLSLHSLMDGVAISAALATHSNLGALVVLGILFHRIPEGGTIASIFLVRGVRQPRCSHGRWRASPHGPPGFGGAVHPAPTHRSHPGIDGRPGPLCGQF